MQRFAVARHEYRTRFLLCLVAQKRSRRSAPRLAALFRSLSIPGGSEVSGVERAGHGLDRAWVVRARARSGSPRLSISAVAPRVDRYLTQTQARRPALSDARTRVHTPSVWVAGRAVLARYVGANDYPRASHRLHTATSVARELVGVAFVRLNVRANEVLLTDPISLVAVDLHRMTSLQSEARPVPVPDHL